MSIRSHPIDPDSLSLEITIRLPTCVRICVLVELEQVFVSDSYFCQLLSYVISLGVRWQWRSVFRRRSRTATCKGVHRWTRPKDESQSFREAAPFGRIWRTATDAICPTSRGWHLRAENAPRLEHHPPPLFLLCWQSRYRHLWLREKDSANAKKRNRACKEVQGDLEVAQ